MRDFRGSLEIRALVLCDRERRPLAETSGQKRGVATRRGPRRPGVLLVGLLLGGRCASAAAAAGMSVVERRRVQYARIW